MECFDIWIMFISPQFSLSPAYCATCDLVFSTYRYDFAKPGVTFVKTMFHWHAHAVGDLCFTTDGEYRV